MKAVDSISKSKNGTIVDGHNRYEICTKHNIKYPQSEMTFKDRTEAKLWIIRNQLDRRNISDFVRTELALKFEDEIRKKARVKQATSTGGLNPQLTKKSAEAEKKPIETRQEIAKMAGVSHDTVGKVKKILEKAPKHIKDKARSGEMKVNTAYNKEAIHPS